MKNSTIIIDIMNSSTKYSPGNWEVLYPTTDKPDKVGFVLHVNDKISFIISTEEASMNVPSVYQMAKEHDQQVLIEPSKLTKLNTNPEIARNMYNRLYDFHKEEIGVRVERIATEIVKLGK